MIQVESEQAMIEFGRRFGQVLSGGEIIELVGDVGAGKTTLVKGLGEGLEIEDDVQSPSFTISRTYEARDNLRLVHYDFYRLTDAGIMANEITESVDDQRVVTIIEWAGIVDDVLPEDRLTVTITPTGETTREIKLHAGGKRALSALKVMQ